jgi:hypothetical protein
VRLKGEHASKRLDGFDGLWWQKTPISQITMGNNRIPEQQKGFLGDSRTKETKQETDVTFKVGNEFPRRAGSSVFMD